MEPTADQIADKMQEALRRIQYDIQLIREGENNWEYDEVEGLYEFKGHLSPFLVSKYTFDLLRETWHLGDGIREYINAKWRAGQVNASYTNLDGGNGPGRAAVKKHINSCDWIQLCGDLANLTKHYHLVHKTQTGDAAPQFGKTAMQMTTSGRMEITRDSESERLKLENPVPVKQTMEVLNVDGEPIADAIQVAVEARDSWMRLLGQMGIRVEGTE